MKRNSSLFFFSLCMWCAVCGGTFAQAPYWAQQAGGATTDEAMDISIDVDGNTYTTGYFSASSAFGTTILSSAGVTDAFICKTDPSGFFQWQLRQEARVRIAHFP